MLLGVTVIWGLRTLKHFKIAVEAAETVLAPSNVDRVRVVKALEYLRSNWKQLN